METTLKNGINSLIAYYFRATNYQFMDEYDFKILVNLAQQCGINIDVDLSSESIANIFESFFPKLDECSARDWAPGIVGNSDTLNRIYNSENKRSEIIRVLKINDGRMNPVINGNESSIKMRILAAFDEMVGEDIVTFKARLPLDEVLKKYLTLKKIVLCKTPDIYNGTFMENVASLNHYKSYDDWASLNDENRGIYPETYNYIKAVEDSFPKREEQKEEGPKKRLVPAKTK